MKKRLFSFLLALCLTASLLPVPALCAEENLSAYVPVLEDAIQNDADSSVFGEAMFYDLDDKAPREMILVRCPEDLTHAVVEVWTIEKGKASRLLREPLYALVGGNFGSVTIGEYQNQSILLTESISQEVDEGILTVEGSIKRFGMEHGAIRQQESAVYTEVRDVSDKAAEDPILYKKSHATIAGKYCSYEDFIDWRHSFILLSANYGFTDEAFDDDAEPFAQARDYCTTGFRDVSLSAWYADAVRWAVEKDVTKGTDAEHFSPNGQCTRAQFVTFLWRAMGKPASRGVTPFTDVPGGQYYTEAVAWAVAQGITNGTSDTTFSPNNTLTRAQVVTFLWRLAGSPKAAKAAAFSDVKSGAYYAEAVAWAVAQGITKGVSDTRFAPADVCTRAQTVTFLYRQLGK